MESIFVSTAINLVYLLILFGLFTIRENDERNKIFKAIVILDFLKNIGSILEFRVLTVSPDNIFNQILIIRTFEIVLECLVFILVLSYIRTYLANSTKLSTRLTIIYKLTNIFAIVIFILNCFKPVLKDASRNICYPNMSVLYLFCVFLTISLYFFILMSERKSITAIETITFLCFPAFGVLDSFILYSGYAFFYGFGSLIAVLLYMYFIRVKEADGMSVVLSSEEQQGLLYKNVVEEQNKKKKNRKKLEAYMILCAITMVILNIITPLSNLFCSSVGRASAVSGMITAVVVLTGIYMSITGQKFGTRCALIAFSISFLNTVQAIVVREQVSAFAGLMQSLTGILAVIIIYVYMKKKDEVHDTIVSQAIITFSEMIDSRDKYTGGHSYRVGCYSSLIAEKLGYDEDEVRRIMRIGLLHDSGKLGISDTILNKQGKLDAEEFEIIKTHTTIGANMLKKFDFIEGMNAGALYHHERYDGTGYPQGLAGEEIPEIGRIIAVADAFDAMNSRRCYREALPVGTIISEISMNKGKQFDPKIADIMLDIIGKEPGKIYEIVENSREK